MGYYPEAPGTEVLTDGKLKVDISNRDKGYIVIRYNGTPVHKLKARLCRDSETYTYLVRKDMEVIPLFEDGHYSQFLYENTHGSMYAFVGGVGFNVKDVDKMGAYLYPNQYVEFTEDSELAKETAKICEGKTASEKFHAIRNYIERYFRYDFIRTLLVKNGELPNAEKCFKEKTGICQDLASMAAAMLRSQGIPARFVIGHADKNYHAWVIAYIDGQPIRLDPTALVRGITKQMRYTEERYC